MNNLKELILGPTMPPHGHCYLWDSNLVTLHVASDAIITASYFTIPIALIYLVKKRSDLSFNYMFVLFAVFIFACGATHLVNIWNVWHGAYWLSGTVKAITALASMGTAILVWPLIPKALAIPSNSQLIELNDRLRYEADQHLRQREQVEALSLELSDLVAARTHELEQLKRLQAEQEFNHQKLKQSNDSLQQFAHVASHDLKEPLRTISSFGTLLSRRAEEKLDEVEQKYLHFINDAAKRMERLIDDLRSFTIISGGKLEPEEVPLDTLLKDTLVDFAAQIENNGVQIQQEPLPLVSGSKTHLGQLVFNLVGNAIKFSRGNDHPKVVIGPLSNTSEHGFFVRDNGIGIDDQHKKRIFGVFERLHSSDEFEGSGIGLAICKKIIEMHNGRISVVSEPGKGAEFQVWLPKLDDLA